MVKITEFLKNNASDPELESNGNWITCDGASWKTRRLYYGFPEYYETMPKEVHDMELPKHERDAYLIRHFIKKAIVDFKGFQNDDGTEVVYDPIIAEHILLSARDHASNIIVESTKLINYQKEENLKN